jgi:hypothetical protein
VVAIPGFEPGFLLLRVHSGLQIRNRVLGVSSVPNGNSNPNPRVESRLQAERVLFGAIHRTDVLYQDLSIERVIQVHCPEV